MMKMMKFPIAILMMTMWMSLLHPLYGLANENDGTLKMDELSVQVMPEYAFHPEDKDRETPSVLIGYHGTLNNQSETPQQGQIQIPLPMKEKNFRIGYVADYARDLSRMNEIEYTVNKETGVISWTTSEEIQPGELYKFVIEFYIDSLSVEDSKKNLDYTFTNFTDIGLLNIIILEPLRTDKIDLEPVAETHQENPYGMGMFIYQYQGLKPNEEKNFKLSYERAEKRTTMEIMEDMTGTDNSVQASKKNETMSTGVLIGSVAGITIVSGGLVVLFLRRKSRTVKVGKRTIEGVDVDMKKARLRKMLVDGGISQQEYNELLKRLGG